MKLYRLNEYEWWAADSMEEAIATAMKTTGLPRDEASDDEFLCEDDPAKVMVLLDEAPLHIADDLKKTAERLREYGIIFEKEAETLEKHHTDLMARCKKSAATIMATMKEPGLVCASEW